MATPKDTPIAQQLSIAAAKEITPSHQQLGEIKRDDKVDAAEELDNASSPTP